MGDDQDALAGMPVEDLVERLGYAGVDLGVALAVRMAVAGRVLHEATIALRLIGADGLPIPPFPGAQIALGEPGVRDRFEIMRLGDDRRGLRGASERATVAHVDGADREKIARALRL